MNRLRQSEIAHHAEKLRPSLTAMQATRLAEIQNLVDDEGRFVLRAALVAAEFPTGDARAQEAFQDFRKKVNEAAKKAGVDLQLELDSRKVPPDQRHGWFTGGDLIDESITTFTGAAASTEVGHSVAPEVSELGEHRRIRVYVSFHPTTGPVARRVDTLLEQLRSRLGADPKRSWDVVDPRSVALGEDAEQTRNRLSTEADVRVALTSPAYLADEVERRRVLDAPGPSVAAALSALPDGPVDLGRLRREEVRRRNEPWDQQTTAKQKTNFVADLADAIQSALTPPPRAERSRDELEAYSHQAYRRKRGNDPDHLVPPELAETTLRESRLDGPLPGGPPVRAVDRLVDWATDDNAGAPRLCALLGDVGMGKTTTAKLFTQRLLELRTRGEKVPLPILFDLRDVRVSELTGSMTLDRILDSMIDATRPTGVSPERLCANVVRQRLDDGDAVVIFDGLDEVLVHLSEHDRQLFTRQLWRSLTSKTTSRMLLTCRTQYFRTIRDQVTFFTGEDRQGLRGSDYLALLMVPFRDEQVREYLAENVDRDPAWVDSFLETIAAVHDLPELTRRPLTLKLIADQLDFIERAKLEGRTLRSVDIYSEVVDRWISRDSGKHTLTPDHKRLLMEEIAAALWRSGSNKWTPAEVDDWLLDILDRRPDLQRHYRERLPDLWKADFRTATFLKREGDTFEFGHRSLFEYFLACHLHRTLRDSGSPESLAMPVPSKETLEFLGQSIAAVPDKPVATLHRIGRHYTPQASELALAYALHAAKHGHPLPDLTGIRLEGAQLSDWTIGTRDQTLSMPDATLTGADLRRTTFIQADLTRANLTNANLTNAEFHDSQLNKSNWDGARAVGTILRRCAIADVDLANAETYRTQVLLCEPSPAPAEGLLIAPTPGTLEKKQSRPLPLRLLTGRTGSVFAVAWSPDGTRILTAGEATAQIWDARTAEQMHHLTGHTGWVDAVAWSPDGTRLLTGGEDAVYVWDAATGQPIHQLTVHTGGVRAVAWSPDSTRLLTCGDEVRVWDAATGQLIHQLAAFTNWVYAAAWSPDGTRILTSGDDAVRVWDAATGQLVQLTVHTGGMGTLAWSPDSTHFLTSGDEVRVWDAATGQPIYHLTDRARSVAWSPDGARLLTSGAATVQLWDTTTSRPIHHLTVHTGWVKAVAWSPDGTRLLTSGDDAVRVWEAATGRPIHQLTVRTGGVRAVAWSPDSTRVFTGGAATVRVWDTTTGQTIHQLAGHTDIVLAVAWSPDGTRLLTSGYNAVRVWDARTGDLMHHLTGHAGWVNAVAWSPDGTRLLTSGDDAVRVWEAATGRPIHQLTDVVQAVAWSPDGTRLLTSGDDAMRVWDAATGQPIHQLTVHTGWVNAVAWSPDGTRLLTSGDDAMRVWDAATGQPIHQLTVHTGWVNAVAWSPDGTRLLTSSNDALRVWDTATGQPIHQPTGHTDIVQAVAWSPDGTRYLTSGGTTARIWDAETGLAELVLVLLPEKEAAVFNGESEEFIGATDGAWRWLGYVVPEDGRLTRLPAETFGPLPPL